MKNLAEKLQVKNRLNHQRKQGEKEPFDNYLVFEDCCVTNLASGKRGRFEPGPSGIQVRALVMLHFLLVKSAYLICAFIYLKLCR